MANIASHGLLVDECVDDLIIQYLRRQNVNIILVRNEYSGQMDDQLVTVALDRQLAILTEDKDFGELVFLGLVPEVTVFLLRYQYGEADQVVI